VRKAAKDHGTRKLVEGADALPHGARVVMVEDVVTTGGSTLAAYQVLRDAGLSVVGVVAVVDRLEGGADAIRAADIPFAALYTRDDIVGAAPVAGSSAP